MGDSNSRVAQVTVIGRGATVAAVNNTVSSVTKDNPCFEDIVKLLRARKFEEALNTTQGWKDANCIFAHHLNLQHSNLTV